MKYSVAILALSQKRARTDAWLTRRNWLRADAGAARIGPAETRAHEGRECGNRRCPGDHASERRADRDRIAPGDAPLEGAPLSPPRPFALTGRAADGWTPGSGNQDRADQLTARSYVTPRVGVCGMMNNSGRAMPKPCA